MKNNLLLLLVFTASAVCHIYINDCPQTVNSNMGNKKVFFGITSTNDWKTYSADGLYVDIDFSDLNLKEVPYVSTNIMGSTSHWTVSGATSIYNIDTRSFRIYIYQKGVTLSFAQSSGWKIQYILYYD